LSFQTQYGAEQKLLPKLRLVGFAEVTGEHLIYEPSIPLTEYREPIPNKKPPAGI
jgi:hypothetical protein